MNKRMFVTILCRIGFLAVGCCLCSLVLQAQARQWTVYRYPGDGFKASFPAEPKITLDENSDVKPRRSYEVRDNSNESVVFLGISVSHYHNHDPLTENQAKAALITSSELARAALHAHLLSQKPIAFGEDQYGLQWEAETANDYISVIGLIVGTRYYEVRVMMPRNSTYPAKRFLDSFHPISEE